MNTPHCICEVKEPYYNSTAGTMRCGGCHKLFESVMVKLEYCKAHEKYYRIDDPEGCPVCFDVEDDDSADE